MSNPVVHHDDKCETTSVERPADHARVADDVAHICGKPASRRIWSWAITTIFILLACVGLVALASQVYLDKVHYHQLEDKLHTATARFTGAHFARDITAYGGGGGEAPPTVVVSPFATVTAPAVTSSTAAAASGNVTTTETSTATIHHLMTVTLGRSSVAIVNGSSTSDVDAIGVTTTATACSGGVADTTFVTVTITATATSTTLVTVTPSAIATPSSSVVVSPSVETFSATVTVTEQGTVTTTTTEQQQVAATPVPVVATFVTTAVTTLTSLSTSTSTSTAIATSPVVTVGGDGNLLTTVTVTTRFATITLKTEGSTILVTETQLAAGTSTAISAVDGVTGNVTSATATFTPLYPNNTQTMTDVSVVGVTSTMTVVDPPPATSVPSGTFSGGIAFGSAGPVTVSGASSTSAGAICLFAAAVSSIVVTFVMMVGA